MQMPFRTNSLYKNKYTNQKTEQRKEKDSLFINHFQSLSHVLGRASAFTSEGSITLEAALVVPLFFFAMLCTVFLLESMAIQTTVRNALYGVGKELAQQAYISPIISPPAIRQNIVKNIGKDKLQRSLIVGGETGLDCKKSFSNWDTGEMFLSVQYKIRIPIGVFQLPDMDKEEVLRVKGWTGNPMPKEETEDEMVYVTEHGSVYHQDIYCPYLDMSVRGIIANTIDGARNMSGEKYKPCDKCEGGKHIGILYVTDYGNRYHTSLNCSKIKRNIYAVSISTVEGLGGCSKCVK